MKRRDFIRYLESNHCYLFREGSRHSVFVNSTNNKTSTVPRHSEIDNYLAKKICKDLNIEIIRLK